MTDNKERDAFEAHYTKQTFTVQRDGDGYKHPTIQKAWEAWQARAALAASQDETALLSIGVNGERLERSIKQLAASQEKAEPIGWQFYDRGRWYNGDDRIKDYRKNTEAAGYPVRDVFAAPVAAQASEPANPSGYAYRYPDAFGGGTVIRFNGGEEVNGSRPIEAIPYWFNAPKPSAAAAIRTLEGLGYTYHGGQQWKPPLGDSRVTVDRLNRLEAARDAALDEAANTATGFLVGDPLAGIPLRNPMPHEIADHIRALKSQPATGKQGGE